MSLGLIKKMVNIDRKKLFFPGQEKGEEIIFSTRRHPLSFLGIFLFAFFMAVLPFIFYLIIVEIGVLNLSLFNQKVVIVLAGSYLLFVLGFFLAAWIDYYLDVMILTNIRIVDITQNVLFSRTIAEADLSDIEDVNAEVEGVLPTFFHYGTVFVQTAGTARNFEFNAIPNPYKVAKMVVDLHQKALLEEEKRETKEIGEAIAKNQETNQVFEKGDLRQAAQKLSKFRVRGMAHYPSQDGQEESNQAQEKDINKEDLEKGGEEKF